MDPATRARHPSTKLLPHRAVRPHPSASTPARIPYQHTKTAIRSLSGPGRIWLIGSQRSGTNDWLMVTTKHVTLTIRRGTVITVQLHVDIHNCLFIAVNKSHTEHVVRCVFLYPGTLNKKEYCHNICSQNETMPPRGALIAWIKRPARNKCFLDAQAFFHLNFTLHSTVLQHIIVNYSWGVQYCKKQQTKLRVYLLLYLSNKYINAHDFLYKLKLFMLEERDLSDTRDIKLI